jgi:hypothetical protein
MIDSMARAVSCPWTVDAGRRGPKGDSVRDTDPFGPWRSGAAGRGQMAVGVVESVIYVPGAAAGVQRARTASAASVISPNEHRNSTGISQPQSCETPKASELLAQ